MTVGQRYIQMHESGLSTSQIANLVGVKKNNVIKVLRYWGKLRQAPGRAIEREVAAWTIGFARTCFQTKGDRPYDLLVDGVRVDVKSAHLSRDRGYDRYYFAINHLGSNPHRSENIDEYYLVLLSEPGRPVYSVPASAVKVKRTMSVSSDIEKSKYPLRLLGYLDAEVQSGGEAE